MDASDADLVRACRAGDDQAWDALVTRYQQLVYAIARRANLSEDQAAEVFQRVFMALIEQLDRLSHPELVGAWLATTARREAWRARRVVRADERILGGDIERAEADGDAPDGELLRLEERDAVRAALATLDVRCRDLLGMLFESPEPLSYAEIADRLRIREGSVGPTRARCLEKLRRRLEELDL